MAAPATLRTDRLLLRNWTAADAAPFAAMNADPLVMEHFPKALDAQESAEMMEHLQHAIRRDGFGFWAVEVNESGLLAGFVGLQRVTNAALAFAGAVEVGWRLDRAFWGRGIASEAARAASEFAFTTLGVDELSRLHGGPQRTLAPRDAEPGHGPGPGRGLHVPVAGGR